MIKQVLDRDDLAAGKDAAVHRAIASLPDHVLRAEPARGDLQLREVVPPPHPISISTPAAGAPPPPPTALSAGSAFLFTGDSSELAAAEELATPVEVAVAPAPPAPWSAPTTFSLRADDAAREEPEAEAEDGACSTRDSEGGLAPRLRAKKRAAATAERTSRATSAAAAPTATRTGMPKRVVLELEPPSAGAAPAPPALPLTSSSCFLHGRRGSSQTKARSAVAVQLARLWWIYAGPDLASSASDSHARERTLLPALFGSGDCRGWIPRPGCRSPALALALALAAGAAAVSENGEERRESGQIEEVEKTCDNILLQFNQSFLY